MKSEKNTSQDKKNQDQEDKIIEEYVKKSQGGDEVAFSFLYDIFIDKIYKYIAYRVPSEDAEDVVAEVFLKAWRNIEKYQVKKGARFNSWIFKIAQNGIIDFYRKKKEFTELNENMEDEKKKSILSEIGSKLDYERVVKALFGLKKNYREVIIMRYMEDLKYSEISKILNKKEGSIRVLIMRGLNEIRKILNCNKNTKNNV